LALVAGCHRHRATDGAPYRVKYVVAETVAAIPQDPGAVFLGMIRGDPETSLSFKVNGQLAQIGRTADGDDWKQGEFVHAGDVLAQVDTANFVNAVTAARARAELARANFARSAELFAAANVAQGEYDAVRAQRDMANAELAQAEQSLRDTTLRAPYDGVVLARLARAGEFASAGRPVLVLGNFRRVQLELGVPDGVLGRLTLGSRHEIIVSAYEGAPFTGEVSEIGMAADPVSRLFRVVLKIDNPDGRLKSGMTANVRLGSQPAASTHIVAIPLSALVATPQAGGTAVFLAGEDGRVHLRAITTAEIVRSSILVREGIRAGDKVVTRGAGQLTDGMPVAAQPEASAKE
jgi:RND family efflux transporter MFP subunit